MWFSTAGVKKTLFEQASFFKTAGVSSVEISNLSSDFSLDNACDFLHNENIKFRFHNYFLQEKEENDFVMNLASLDDEVASKTIQKIKTGIEYSRIYNIGYYAFHAGFFLNLSGFELGDKVVAEPYSEYEKKRAEIYFYDRLAKICDIAKQAGVQLGVETNVCNKATLLQFDRHCPFMASSRTQILDFVRNKPKDVGLLWDFGHVKVSAETFQFCPRALYDEVSQYINGLHLSDNNGKDDQNLPVLQGHWSLQEMKYFKNVTFEVYGEENIIRQIRVLDEENHDYR